MLGLASPGQMMLDLGLVIGNSGSDAVGSGARLATPGQMMTHVGRVCPDP